MVTYTWKLNDEEMIHQDLKCNYTLLSIRNIKRQQQQI